MEEYAIQVENLTKKYRIGSIGYGSLRKDLQSLFAKIRKKEDPNSKITGQKRVKGNELTALDHISFSVKKGERVGIIGKNGAGKSTLLKLISGITIPTEGIIRIDGKVAGMLEVGTGFHPELTGRENIFLNGAIMGMTKKETARKLDKIIAFSECEQFIDTPVKRYSSGMLVRLAFAVAAFLDNDIMILDEVLTVGDRSFWQKSVDKLKEIALTEGRTILCVSHNMDTVRSICKRSIVLQEGKIVFDGDTQEGISLYETFCMPSEKEIL